MSRPLIAQGSRIRPCLDAVVARHTGAARMGQVARPVGVHVIAPAKLDCFVWEVVKVNPDGSVEAAFHGFLMTVRSWIRA